MSPTSDTGTLSTSLRANAPTHNTSKIKSTPNSRGAAVISENIGVLGVQVAELRPWIQRDIVQAKQCKVDAVLQTLLQRASCTPEIIQPELLWHHTFTNPTSAIREALGVLVPTTGSRVLYILVFRKLRHITELHGKELFDVWYQCILCHFTLWKEGVHHRDVSPPNLMWYRKDGKRIGVLKDYDLSSLADEPGPRGNERTGTVPFMALDLLTEEGQRGEVEYLYRHDLESFMWCFAWISVRYENGALLPTGLRPFDEWARLDAVACGDKKNRFQSDGERPASATLKDESAWMLIQTCMDVLTQRKLRSRLRLQLANALANSQESESASDMDRFLAEFTTTEAWVALSSPAPTQ